MSARLEQSFRELKGYIEGHPTIKIGEAVSIPSEFRTEFYLKFDEVRDIAIDDILAPALFDNALVLSQNYAEVEKYIIKKFKLREITLEQRLRQFLNDPKHLLIEELYFPLFDVLKGKIDLDTFQKNCLVLSARFYEMYRLGYGKWVSLTALKLFKANRIGLCNMRFDAKSQMRGHLTEEKPHCIGVDYIEFNRNKPFIVPDFAAYSPENRCYLAVKTEMQRGGVKFACSSTSTETRRWIPSDPGLKTFTPDNIYIYVSKNMEEISLLENQATCCPDAIIRCFPQHDWYTKERWQETIALHEKLSPQITCVLGQTPTSETYQADDRIKIIDAGFEQSGLADIINELVEPFKMAVAAKEKQSVKSVIAKWGKRLTSPFSFKAPESKYL